MRHLNLEQALAAILKQYPEGKSEYALFTLLQQPPFELFAKNSLAEPLILFQSHFVLFHSLYQLRARYLHQQSADIAIHTSHIQLLPYQVNKPELTEPDRLQAYYLDWSNFAATSAQDVTCLLDSFWKKMQGLKTQTELDDIAIAYQFFDLPYNSDIRLVKSAYFKFQHLHHPDKGGDISKSQQTEANFKRLKKYLIY